MSARVARVVGLNLVLGCLLSGCYLFDSDRWAGNDPDAVRRAEDPYHTDPKYADPEAYNARAVGPEASAGVFGYLFGDDKKNKNGGGGGGGGGAGINVNSYLWRATLDTVSFMPLASADPFGGVIISDWYSPPDTPNERFKVNIFILGRDLRADGVKASVFHQKRDASGQWADASVDQKTGTDLENAILARAREIRLSTAAAQ
jgi:hypothetical protein